MALVVFPVGPLAAPIPLGTDKASKIEYRLRLAMFQAMPADPGERLVFTFDTDTQWTTSVLDSDDVPFRPDAVKVATSGREPVDTAYYAVTFMDQRRSHPTRAGDVSVSELVVTILDVDYQQIKGCTGCVAAEDSYVLKRREPPVQMPGGPLVHTLRFEAVKETAL